MRAYHVLKVLKMDFIEQINLDALDHAWGREVRPEIAESLRRWRDDTGEALQVGASLPAAAVSLFQLFRNDLQRDEPVLTDDADRQLRADAGLHHQPLQVSGL